MAKIENRSKRSFALGHVPGKPHALLHPEQVAELPDEQVEKLVKLYPGELKQVYDAPAAEEKAEKKKKS